MKMVATLAGFAALITSCAMPTQGEEPSAFTRDATLFTADVHPLLEASCATLDCHGASRRPLRLYAETGRRVDRALRTEHVTGAELAANMQSLFAIDEGARSLANVDAWMVLTKPLALSAGGVHHVGGDLWPSRAHPAYVCVRAFLLGTSAEAASREACRLAYEEVKLPEPEPPVQ